MPLSNLNSFQFIPRSQSSNLSRVSAGSQLERQPRSLLYCTPIALQCRSGGKNALCSRGLHGEESDWSSRLINTADELGRYRGRDLASTMSKRPKGNM